MPHNSFQVHAGSRLTGSKAFGFCYYSNFVSIYTHWTSPYQKLLNWCCNIGWRWRKVGRQNLRCDTAGNWRWRCRHCKQGINLKTTDKLTITVLWYLKKKKKKANNKPKKTQFAYTTFVCAGVWCTMGNFSFMRSILLIAVQTLHMKNYVQKHLPC